MNRRKEKSPFDQAFIIITNDRNVEQRLNKKIPNESDLHDAKQEAYLKLHKTYQSKTDLLTPRLAFENIVFKTIINCWRNAHKMERRRKRREKHREELRMGTPCGQRRMGAVCVDVHSHRTHPEWNPLAELERRETRVKIESAWRAAGLSPDHERALLSSLDEPIAEFAKREKMPATTARTWVRRAKLRLRPYLEREGLLAPETLRGQASFCAGT